jgi:DNA-binding XRE family transcriptional regulator
MDKGLIQLIRMNMRLNQHKFAELLGVHRSDLANVEAGYRDPSDKLIEKIYENVDGEFITQVKAIYQWRKD